MTTIIGIIGLGLALFPVTLIGTEGITQMKKKFGNVATAALFVALPFYLFTIMAMFKAVGKCMEDIMYHAEDIIIAEYFTRFDGISVVILIICAIVYTIAARLHDRKLNS